MDPRTFENSYRSNPETNALPSPSIRMFLYSKVREGKSNSHNSSLHRINLHERFPFREGIPCLAFIMIGG